MNSHWKEWCWSWISNTLAIWYKEPTHWKRPWCWERLKAGGEGDNRRWDGCMASPTQWKWVWINSGSLLKFMSIESVMPSNHLILCHSHLLLPSIFPSIRVFSNESVLHIRWPKYWSFSFSISPSNEYSGLISFRMDWLYLLAVQGTLKSLLLTPQFKSTNSLALSFLYSPTLTSIYDQWKNHSFD